VISTLHGKLPLNIIPDEDAAVSMRNRIHVCKVRGKALGQHLNFEITLDANTGEMLLMSPDGFVGAFRIGDLIVAQVSQMLARAQREKDLEANHA
jgi:hypothetical protein